MCRFGEVGKINLASFYFSITYLIRFSRPTSLGTQNPTGKGTLSTPKHPFEKLGEEKDGGGCSVLILGTHPLLPNE